MPANCSAANCSAAKQLPQFYKHSKSADLLRKSLLSHVWRVPSSKALSCKHERLFDLLTLASSLCQFSLAFLHFDPIDHQTEKIVRHMSVAELPVLYRAVGDPKIIGKLSSVHSGGFTKFHQLFCQFHNFSSSAVNQTFSPG